MICKVLTQLGYTNRLIYTLLTVRLATACRTRSLRVARMQSFICMHFQRDFRDFWDLVMELVGHAERVIL